MRATSPAAPRSTPSASSPRCATGSWSLRQQFLRRDREVADALAHEEGDVAIVCAGNTDGFALEDAIGAGALVDTLLTLIGDVELKDGARAAALLYRAVAGRLSEAIASSDHAQTLSRKGFASDVTRCAALDALDVVPTLRDGILVVTPAVSPA